MFSYVLKPIHLHLGFSTFRVPASVIKWSESDEKRTQTQIKTFHASPSLFSLSTRRCDKETIYCSKEEMRKHVWLRIQKEDEQKRSRWRKVIYEFVNFPNLLPQPEKADTEWKSVGRLWDLLQFLIIAFKNKEGKRRDLGQILIFNHEFLTVQLSSKKAGKELKIINSCLNNRDHSQKG